MGIPIDKQYSTTVTSGVTRAATCEKCEIDFLYRVDHQSSSASSSVLELNKNDSSEHSSAGSKKSVGQVLDKTIDAVPCPRCGWYQSHMVQIARWGRAIWVGGILCLVGGLVMGIDAMWGSAQFYKYWPLLLGMSGLTGAGILVISNPNSGYCSEKGSPGRALASRGVPLAELDAGSGVTNESLEVELNRCLRSAMLSMAGIDGVIDPDELYAISRVYEQVTEERVDLGTFERETRAALGQHERMLNSLNCLAPYLEYEGKAMFIRAVLVIAAADGNIDQTEWKLIEAIGKHLDMETTDVKVIIDKMAA